MAAPVADTALHQHPPPARVGACKQQLVTTGEGEGASTRSWRQRRCGRRRGPRATGVQGGCACLAQWGRYQTHKTQQRRCRQAERRPREWARSQRVHAASFATRLFKAV